MPDENDRTGILAPPPLINAAGLALGYALDRFVPIGRVPLAPTPRFALALLLFLAGAALAAWALVAFKRAGTTPNPYGGTSFLVPAGPYRRTRNPMYVGMLTSYLGVALALAGIWSFVLWPAVALTLHVGVVRREERYLEEKFGDAYRAYCARVRRWV